MHAAACAPQAHGCSQRARVLRSTVALPPSPRGSGAAHPSAPSPRRRLLPPCSPPGQPHLAHHARHATPGTTHGRELQRPPRQELPNPPSACAGTTASTSTTTTLSSSASAAPGACSRSSSGTARWACRSRCAPLPRPAFGPTLVGWPRRAGTCARHRSRTSACVCASDLTSLLLTFADLLLAAAKVGHVRVDQHFPQEQPRRPQVSLRRVGATSCSVHVDAACLCGTHRTSARPGPPLWPSLLARRGPAKPLLTCYGRRLPGGPVGASRETGTSSPVRRTRSPGAPSNAVFRIWPI